MIFLKERVHWNELITTLESFLTCCLCGCLSVVTRLTNAVVLEEIARIRRTDNNKTTVKQQYLLLLLLLLLLLICLLVKNSFEAVDFLAVCVPLSWQLVTDVSGQTVVKETHAAVCKLSACSVGTTKCTTSMLNVLVQFMRYFLIFSCCFVAISK